MLRKQPQYSLIDVHCPLCESHKKAVFLSKMNLDNLKSDNFQYVQCNSCGLVFVSPRREDIEYYLNLPSSYTKNVDTYISSVSIPGFIFLLDRLEERWFSMKSYRGNLLEVGCAVGFFLDAARARGWKTTGIEPAKPLADWGKKYLQLDIINATLEEATTSPNSSDVIVAIEFIEHVRYPRRILEKLKTWLKSSGMIFLTTPNLDSLEFEEKGDDWNILDPRDHLTIFSPKTLEDLLVQVGFKNVNVSATGGKFGDLHLLCSANTYASG